MTDKPSESLIEEDSERVDVVAATREQVLFAYDQARDLLEASLDGDVPLCWVLSQVWLAQLTILAQVKPMGSVGETARRLDPAHVHLHSALHDACEELHELNLRRSRH